MLGSIDRSKTSFREVGTLRIFGKAPPHLPLIATSLKQSHFRWHHSTPNPVNFVQNIDTHTSSHELRALLRKMLFLCLYIFNTGEFFDGGWAFHPSFCSLFSGTTQQHSRPFFIPGFRVCFECESRYTASPTVMTTL